MDVLNRTTKEFLLSRNEPSYPTADWIHDPDMSAVTGLPSAQWIIEGDAVRAMTDAEKDANILDDVKAAKMVEINNRTDELIAVGFEFPASSGKFISLSLESQSMLEGLYQARNNPAVTYSIDWSTLDDTSKIQLDDAADVESIFLTALGTIRGHKDSGNALKDSVRAAITVAAVDAVTDTR